MTALPSNSALEGGPPKGTPDVIYSVNLGHPQRENEHESKNQNIVGIEAERREEQGAELIMIQRQDGSDVPVPATQAAHTGIGALQGDANVDNKEMLALPEPDNSEARQLGGPELEEKLG